MKIPSIRDTGVARLPGLPPVNAQDPSLRSWMSAVAERLEVREGSRGNPWERAVTVRELTDMSTVTTRLLAGRDGKDAGKVLVDLGGGLTAGVDIDKFVDDIKSTTLYRDLIKRLDDPTRFDNVVGEVRTILLKDIADEAVARGADIQRMDVKIQAADRSLAYTVQEITAALGQNSAGVREVQWAFADANKAQAGKITQLRARLNNFYPDGRPGGATIEQQFGVYANYTDGLRGQYTLKINAGGAVAGFGLSATEINGAPSSAFIIQADKFAIVSGSYSGGLTNSPDTNSVPFGVDANGVYINGRVRINASGRTIGDVSNQPGVKGDKGDEGPRGLIGQAGINGQRGSRTVYGQGDYSDAYASSLIATATGGTPVLGDTAAITNASTTVTRYWDGFGWANPGVVIDGNLIVSGSIAGNKIAANSLSAAQLRLASLYGTVAFDTADNGTGTVMRISPASAAYWGLFISQGSLYVGGGDIFCRALSTTSITSSGSVSAVSVTASGGFGCNGRSAQGPFSLGPAATDPPSALALTNNIRAILIANGIGTA